MNRKDYLAKGISAGMIAIPITLLNIVSIFKSIIHIFQNTIILSDVENIIFAVISILLGCTAIIVSIRIDEKSEVKERNKQMALALACAILCELIAPFEWNSCLMLIAPICLVAVLMYASISLMRYWSVIFIASYLFVLIVMRIINWQYQIDIDAHFLSQVLWPSPNDVENAMTPSNILFVVAVILCSVSFGIVLVKAFGRAPRKQVLINSFLLTACIACSVRSHQPTMNALKSYNPTIPCALYNMYFGYTLACEIKDSCLKKLAALPSPAAEKSSIHTLTGGEGCICILHIGESVRSDHLSINGYTKDTTPWLRKQERIVNFKNCTSIAPLTTDAIPTIITNASGNISSKISMELEATTGSVMDLFSANNFDCFAFYAGEAREDKNHPATGIFERMIPMLTSTAKKKYSYRNDGPDLPKQQIDQVVDALKESKGNCFLLINNSGSHFPFSAYDAHNPTYTPSDPDAYGSTNRDDPQIALKIINAYDNTIIYTDEYIRDLLSKFEGRPFLYMYISDHGEPLGDEGIWMRQFKNYHKSEYCKVPFFILYSKEFETLHPHFAKAISQMRNNSQVPVAHENIFHTLLGIFDIRTPYYDPRYDASSSTLEPYRGPSPDRGGESEDGLKWE